MPLAIALPTFESRLAEIAAAERGDGWLSVCERDGRFLVPTQELVAVLTRRLRPLRDGPILEVCAGRGELAEALRLADVCVIPTDADPPDGSRVVRASAEEALRRYRPAVVLGSFVPIDAGVDERVMRFPTVQDYVVLGARIGGLFGSAPLWRSEGWVAEPIHEVARWMLTRHDVWTGKSRQRILRHGEAWHFRRKAQVGHASA
jgi:hypothetical protein